MIKTITFLFLTLLFISCGKSGGSQSSSGDEVSLDEVSVGSPVPSAALNFDVNIKLDNFSPGQENKILTASDLIRKVVASEEFKDAILNHSYKGQKTFVDNGGKSNAQIYASIIEGSERLRPGVDNEMDLDLEVFNRNDDTVGYTFPSEIRVWMNGKFLNRNSPAKVTTNMMHEWLHKLGYNHSYESNASRPYSVPYAIGYLVSRLAQRLNH